MNDFKAMDTTSWAIHCRCQILSHADVVRPYFSLFVRVPSFGPMLDVGLFASCRTSWASKKRFFLACETIGQVWIRHGS